MIAADRQRAALWAINGVLVVMRSLAHAGSEPRALAEMLDWAEYLPMLILEREDCTDRFRAALEELVRMHANFGLALLRFDEPDAMR